MILADTHCHLYLNHFEEDLDEVFKRAVNSGVRHIFLPAIDWHSLEQMEKLNHPEITFYKMAGIHPCDIKGERPALEEKLMEYCSQPDIVGVGETGLDYYWSKEHIPEQKRSLRIHCDVAKAVNKPVILHNRESTSDLLDIIEEEQDGNLKGVWHCFSGTVDEGKRALDLGLYIGIGGVATFKNAGVDKVVKELPLEIMILETDAPYLTPEPHRGERNEPSYIKYTAEKLAELKELNTKDIAKVTTLNAFRLFDIN